MAYMTTKHRRTQAVANPPAEICIQTKWCKNCGICVEFCPKKVFTSGKLNEPLISCPEKCSCCRLCELRCPEFAVTVTEKEAKVHA